MTGINWADWGLTEPIQMEPVKGGLINTSLRAEWVDGTVRFVQRVNLEVFQDLEAIEANQLLAQDHPIRDLAVLPVCRSDGRIHCAAGWRIFQWTSDYPKQIGPQELGEFWGNVNSVLFTAKADWKTVVPNFHSAAVRWNQWQAACFNVPFEYLDLVEFLNQWSEQFLQLESELLPAVQHHDAKQSNVLNTVSGLRVIDLDTLQPGYLGSDFADLVRSTAALRGEDDPLPNSADAAAFEAAWKGYSSGFKMATKYISTLRQMPAYLTWIQALRFATDAADGNRYYRVSYPEHNWVRANNQAQLLRSLVEICDRD
jgi:hypothetical protein